MSARRQSGAVSLFVVIFSMLLITVITVSFMRLMMTEQRQSADNELAQSAYDSAQAGVEDAKRALLRFQNICNTTTDPNECARLSDQLSQCDPAVPASCVILNDSSTCNQALKIGNIAVTKEGSGVDTGKGEVMVQQNEGVDAALDQAYTCVKIQMQTKDYILNVAEGQSQLVPLVSRQSFDTVTIGWFSAKDLSDPSAAVTPKSSVALTEKDTWGVNTPPVLRAQLMQFSNRFTMSDFDFVPSVSGATQSNTNSVFLFPTSTAGTSSGTFTGLDNRKRDENTDPSRKPLTGVRCEANFNASDYACLMSLRLPVPINGSAANRTAFLLVTPYYNATSVQIRLSNGVPLANESNLVRFQDVQPVIDSTGRANDIFRRVEARVDLANMNVIFPDATIDITGNLCKNFSVSPQASTYATTNTSCTP